MFFHFVSLNNFFQTKESGKALLKTITIKRAQQEAVDEDTCIEESEQMVMSTSENAETM